VECRTYDPHYLAEARSKIEVAAEVVRAAVAADGRLGACVDASGMLARMLDRLGVWAYVAKVTLTVNFNPSTGHSPQYFWVLDEGRFVAAHAVVVAPPYYVVDVTVKHQHYNEATSSLMPDKLLVDEFTTAQWEPEDLANPAIRAAATVRGPFDLYLKRHHPQMPEVMHALPARRANRGLVGCKYVPVAVGGTIEDLEGMTGYKPCGRTALELFRDEVLPRLQGR
jgi:hypothetical protein